MEEFLKNIEIDISEAESQQVFSSIGVCLYLIQCLELNIVTMLLFIDFVPKGLENPEIRSQWKEAFEEYEKNVWQLTLGRLIGKLRINIQVNDEIFEKLEKCLARRNWLIHHFVRDKAATLFLAEGRKEILKIIETDKALFSETTDLLTERVLSLLERNGYERKMIYVKVRKLLMGVENF